MRTPAASNACQRAASPPCSSVKRFETVTVAELTGPSNSKARASLSDPA
jgi:hypothetical protein